MGQVVYAGSIIIVCVKLFSIVVVTLYTSSSHVWVLFKFDRRPLTSHCVWCLEAEVVVVVVVAPVATLPTLSLPGGDGSPGFH